MTSEDVSSAGRALGLTPLAVETMIQAVRAASNRTGRPAPLGTWVSGAIIVHAQMEQEAAGRLKIMVDKQPPSSAFWDDLRQDLAANDPEYRTVFEAASNAIAAVDADHRLAEQAATLAAHRAGTTVAAWTTHTVLAEAAFQMLGLLGDAEADLTADDIVVLHALHDWIDSQE